MKIRHQIPNKRDKKFYAFLTYPQKTQYPCAIFYLTINFINKFRVTVTTALNFLSRLSLAATTNQ